MKTAIKFTAIAVITLLVALACSPEAELTSRDYGDRNESKNKGYTNSPGSSFLPSFSSTALRYYAPTDTTVSEQNKETTLTFPVINLGGNRMTADVLRASNVNAALHEFLSFSQYTNPPATAPTAGTPEWVWKPSNLTDPVNYSFVRREGDNKIVIKIDVPNIDYIVYKIDASKFKVGGQTLDINGDGKTDIYDDQYTQIRIANYTNTIEGNGSYTNDFYGPVATITINISDPSGGSFNTETAMPKLFAISESYSLIGFTSPYENGANNAYMRRILSDLVSKIEIQKYNQANNTWAKEGTVALFEGGTTSPTGSGITDWTDDLIYGSFTPVDLGIYRLKMTGIANLTTKENFGATGKPAKIKIGNLSFLRNTYYSTPVRWYNTDARQWETDNPIQTVKVRYDSNKRNVVLDMFFNPIYNNNAGANVWLEPMQIAEFNKNFKMVYKPNGDTLIAGASLTGLTPGEDIIEIKVNKVEYSASKYFDATNANTNCITVTLDPSYKFDGNRQITILLTTGFKYAGGFVTFGSNDISNSYYNGAYFWRSYGTLPINL